MAIANASQTKKRTRIQEQKERIILDGAVKVFSTYGFHGTSVERIADEVGMSKPNLLYYYRRKSDIYLAVLKRTLEMWLEPLETLDPQGLPEQEITYYIKRKIEMSRLHPEASRLFVSEMLLGAPVMEQVLGTRVSELVERKVAVINTWIAEGRLRKIDPYHLLFMIWSTTQHYADFEVQVRAVLPHGDDRDRVFVEASQSICGIIMQGILPAPENTGAA